jgi:hypothetical protein
MVSVGGRLGMGPNEGLVYPVPALPWSLRDVGAVGRRDSGTKLKTAEHWVLLITANLDLPPLQQRPRQLTTTTTTDRDYTPRPRQLTTDHDNTAHDH